MFSVRTHSFFLHLD